MKSTGVIRRVDELGRVVIPIEIRKILEIKEKDSLGIFLEDEGIFIKKQEPHCVFCNSNINLETFYNKKICKNCIKELK